MRERVVEHVVGIGACLDLEDERLRGSLVGDEHAEAIGGAVPDERDADAVGLPLIQLQDLLLREWGSWWSRSLLRLTDHDHARRH